MNTAIEDLIKISQFANRPDAVQGSGGNSSVKTSTEQMLIKASGYELGDISPESGFASIRYPDFQSFFKKNNNSLDQKAEDLYSQMIKQNQGPRASMETGFHTILDRCVLHSHSVYANLLSCAKEGKQIFKELFNNASWVGYAKPGYAISCEIYKAPKSKIFFLESHGLVISTDDANECIALHQLVEDTIKKEFSIKEDYPKITISSDQKSTTKFIETSIQDLQIDSLATELENKTLFPDQTVFFKNNINHSSAKLNIDNKQKISYQAGQKEAKAYEECICAYLFIRKQLAAKSLTPKYLADDSSKAIAAMESEKHRQAILSDAD